jgi:hypothetical protein
MPYAVTANRLSDGRVVFQAADGHWSLDLEKAVLEPSEPAAAPALEKAQADERRNVIVDPYLVQIEVGGPSRRPARLREAIRAFGPTIAYKPSVPFLEAAE